MNDNLVKAQFKFDDFDHFSEFINQADVEYLQLTAGKFEGELIQIKCGPIMIGKHKMGCKILQVGAGIKGYTTFLILGGMEVESNWRKRRLKGNIIGILKGNTEHYSVSFANFYGTPVSIENNFLIEMSEILGYSNFNKKIINSEIITISVDAAKRIHQMVNTLCEKPIIDRSMLIYDLPELIINSIMFNESKDIWINGRGKGEIFKNAQDYIHQNVEESIKITSLCENLSVSERNLRYAFHEQAGISPKQYIHYYKLHMVRKLLHSGKVEKIKDAANQMGFWHTGQFAIDYKRFFGQLPSEDFKE